VEWAAGPDGYIRWYLDDEFMYGVGANALNKTGAVIPEEPMCVTTTVTVTITVNVTIACHPSRDCVPVPALIVHTALIPSMASFGCLCLCPVQVPAPQHRHQLHVGLPAALPGGVRLRLLRLPQGDAPPPI